MNHPEIFIVPGLLLADYFLTVLGATLKERKYDKFFKSSHYELNPRWQANIANKKWFNMRHLGLTALVASFLVYVSEFANLPNEIVHGFISCLVIFFGAIVGRHLSNICVFRRLIGKSDDIHGEITMSHALALAISLYQTVIVLVPVLILTVLYPSPVLVGAFIGSLLLVAVHLRWLRQHKKKQEASNNGMNADQ